MNYRDALLAARRGATVTRGARVVRFLTTAEAHEYLLAVLDHESDLNARRLGLFDVGGAEPAPFRPTEAEQAADDWS